MTPEFPRGWLRELLESDATTPATREAMQERLALSDTAPRFFSAREIATLRAVCARLVGQTEPPLDLAGYADAQLFEGKGNGWRYDTLPPDGQAWKMGLRGLNESARNGDFAALSDDDQDVILRQVQNGEIAGEIWADLDAKRWFEEVFGEIVALFYAHSVGQEEIGFNGFADAPGWTQIGLNEREEREPEEIVGARPASPSFAGNLTQKGEAGLAPTIAAKEEVDAVIIGTGAGGAPILARLAQAGLKVVALEAGKWWNPQRDFATDERAQEKLFWNDERLSAGNDPLAFGGNNSGTGVGGSTLHFTAYTPRAQPDDFRLATEFGVGCDWPLGYEDLEPYYDELEGFLGVSGPSPYPWGPPRKQKYPLAPLPLNAAAQLMQRGCDKLGIQTSPAANAALSAPYFQENVGWRNACTNRGFCQAGCSTGAKASMDVTFVPLALAHGAEIRPECFVTRLETQNGRVTGVIYLRNGREERQKCRNVFLCAGAIETPRLLLLNKLGNASGQVGRNFMAHTGMQLWGQFEEETRPFKGIPGALISEETHRPKNADFAGGYLLQSIGVMPVTYASQFARGQGTKGVWGEKLREHMTAYNHTAGINILGDCLPYAENFVELSDELDGRGFAKPRVHFSAGQNEKRMHAHALKTMCAVFEAAGARETWSFERFAHIIGTCRMGADEQKSVVNADCRSFEVPNLFICDNSVFPSALSANPALTIMALALRTADRFLASKATE